MKTIRPPRWILVAPHAMRQLNRLALTDVHDKDVEVSRFVAARPSESDELSVGAPGRIRYIAFAGCEHFDVASIDIHAPELLVTGTAGDEHHLVAIPWIYLWRNLDGAYIR